MPDKIETRQTTNNDLVSLEFLYKSAFPDEDLYPLVNSLLHQKENVLSIVATTNKSIVGHIIFTFCDLGVRKKCVALLGPLAVLPTHQKKGIGTMLVQNHHKKLGNIDYILVLGDPNYYSRFGFQLENTIKPPYCLPPEYLQGWQSLILSGKDNKPEETLSVPKPWQQESLWLP